MSTYHFPRLSKAVFGQEKLKVPNLLATLHFLVFGVALISDEMDLCVWCACVYGSCGCVFVCVCVCMVRVGVYVCVWVCVWFVCILYVCILYVCVLCVCVFGGVV